MDKTEITRGNPELLDLTPIRAIRAYCLDCACGSISEVRDCVKDGKRSILCPLYKYRLGHNPNRKAREYTEEERQAIAERLAKYRKNRENSFDNKGDFEFVGLDDESIPPSQRINISVDSDEEEIEIIDRSNT